MDIFIISLNLRIYVLKNVINIGFVMKFIYCSHTFILLNLNTFYIAMVSTSPYNRTIINMTMKKRKI